MDASTNRTNGEHPKTEEQKTVAFVYRIKAMSLTFTLSDSEQL